MAQKFLTDVEIDGFIKLLTENANANTGKFLVHSADGKIKHRTAQELREDLGLLSDLSFLKKEQFEFGSSQQFTLAHNYSQVYSVSVSGGGALHSSQYNLVAPNKIEILDPLEAGDYIVVLYATTQVGIQTTYTQAEIDAMFDEDRFENPEATYNSTDQLERIDYDNGKYKEFTYNASGQLTEVEVNGIYKKVLAYDAQGRWISTTKIIL